MQQISVEDRAGTCWITLRGELDQQEVLDLKARFDQAVQSTAGDVVLDLGQVDFIGTLGIGLIVSTRKQLEGEGRTLKLSSVPALIEQTFETMSLADIFERV